jgi:hypothetical protein
VEPRLYPSVHVAYAHICPAIAPDSFCGFILLRTIIRRPELGTIVRELSVFGCTGNLCEIDAAEYDYDVDERELTEWHASVLWS